jgi:hypothetical protein
VLKRTAPALVLTYAMWSPVRYRNRPETATPAWVHATYPSFLPGEAQRDGESDPDGGGDEVFKAAIIDRHAVADRLQPIHRALVLRNDSVAAVP